MCPDGEDHSTVSIVRKGKGLSQLLACLVNVYLVEFFISLFFLGWCMASHSGSFVNICYSTRVRKKCTNGKCVGMIPVNKGIAMPLCVCVLCISVWGKPTGSSAPIIIKVLVLYEGLGLI